MSTTLTIILSNVPVFIAILAYFVRQEIRITLLHREIEILKEHITKCQQHWDNHLH
jgi:hypothetical protein